MPALFRALLTFIYERGAIRGRKCLIDNACPVRKCGIMAQKAQKAQKCFQASRPFLEMVQAWRRQYSVFSFRCSGRVDFRVRLIPLTDPEDDDVRQDFPKRCSNNVI